LIRPATVENEEERNCLVLGRKVVPEDDGTVRDLY
jgi:hypothetical protein